MIFLFVEPPVIDERPEPTIQDPRDGDASFNPGERPQVLSNRDVTLRCPVSGHPKPQIIWKFADGSELGIGETSGKRTVSDDGSLTITNVQSIDSALYKCVVSSDGGTDQTDFDVTVVGGQMKIELILP